MNQATTERQYVAAALERYQRWVGASVRPRQADRRLAADLHQRGISIATLDAAMQLALARRTARPASAPALAPIRSLHYFLPLIHEILGSKNAQRYTNYMLERIESATRPQPATVQKTTDSHDR
jgi:hypothetical protein